MFFICVLHSVPNWWNWGTYRHMCIANTDLKNVCCLFREGWINLRRWTCVLNVFPWFSEIILTYQDMYSKAHLCFCSVVLHVDMPRLWEGIYTKIWTAKALQNWIINIIDGAIHIRALLLNCTYRFKTWNALPSHLSRNHPAQRTVTKAVSTFKCHICYDQLHRKGIFSTS